MSDDLEKQNGEVPDVPILEKSSIPELLDVEDEELNFLKDGWIVY